MGAPKETIDRRKFLSLSNSDILSSILYRVRPAPVLVRREFRNDAVEDEVVVSAGRPMRAGSDARKRRGSIGGTFPQFGQMMIASPDGARAASGTIRGRRFRGAWRRLRLACRAMSIARRDKG